MNSRKDNVFIHSKVKALNLDFFKFFAFQSFAKETFYQFSCSFIVIFSKIKPL